MHVEKYNGLLKNNRDKIKKTSRNKFLKNSYQAEKFPKTKVKVYFKYSILFKYVIWK